MCWQDRLCEHMSFLSGKTGAAVGPAYSFGHEQLFVKIIYPFGAIDSSLYSQIWLLFISGDGAVQLRYGHRYALTG